jgi:integrase
MPYNMGIIFGAGLRVGETVAIRVEDIDFGKASHHIRSANAKLKKARTVVLLPPVIEALQKYLAGRTGGWLFPATAAIGSLPSLS